MVEEKMGGRSWTPAIRMVYNSIAGIRHIAFLAGFEIIADIKT
jgi:hypothetical protein